MIRILLPALMGLCLMPMLPMASAQPTEGPEYVERWTFDPETGQWLEMARPEPGTEDGDLDLARQALAREDYTAAREQTEAWIETYGGAADRYPEALYVSATALLGLGDYRAAYDAYSALLNDFPGSVFAERAVAAQFRIGEQYLDGQRRKAWRGLLRVRDYDKGLEIMDDIVANHGGTDLAELALKTKADYYYRKGEFELAEDEYARLARDYPQSRYEPYALLQGAQSAMASFPGVNFDDAGLVEAEERFVQFRDRYPALAEAKQVPVILEQIRATRAQKEFVTAEYYIRTKQKRAAAYYFRSTIQHWPGTTWAAQAEARLVAMGLWEPAADEPTAATELPARVAMAGSE